MRIGFKTQALTTLLLTVVGSAAFVGRASAQEFNGTPSHSARATPTGNIIVKWRKQPTNRSSTGATHAQKASVASGLKLQKIAGITDDFELFGSAERLSPRGLEVAVAQLQHDSEIEYAAIEYRRQAHAVTSDPLLVDQWYLLSAQPAATRSDAAWDKSTGSASVVVAVLDTGVRFDHPDLGRVGEPGGKLLPGRDFVSNVAVANDGDARDADPSDPGDWVDSGDVNDPLFSDCDVSSSSWHGTRVSGLIGAGTNNATGVAGNAYRTLILPVRVLGKCGGTDFDIIAGMRWAAGLTVDGNTNPNPANVINMSLGGEGACTPAYQAVVDEVTARGTLVVASAGNEGGPVSAPANCNGVVGVAGLRHAGTKVGFSNLGPEVAIGAPGGNCVNTGAGQPCLYSIIVATNSGTSGPGSHTYTTPLNYNVGTSFSAPMVASAAALVKAVNGALTPAQITLLLKESASAFPFDPAVRTCTVPTATSPLQDAECNCTTQTCGAGMLNTAAAVNAASAPVAVVQVTGTLQGGQTITLDGATSFAGPQRTLTSYQWSLVSVAGSTPTIANANQATTTMQLTGASQITLRLTIADDQGTQDTKDVALTAEAPPAPPSPPTTPPASGGSAPTATGGIGGSGGGGGGGELGYELLLLGVLASARRMRRCENV